ncbi:MAG: uracil-xanthine permease family protein [Spirochaetaceae bacterium JB067]
MSLSSQQRDEARSELIFSLNEKPPIGQALVAALQHAAAIFIGIITPPIVVAGALGLDSAMKSYLISMSLLVSGIATFIQCRKIGPVGSGLLAIQGTSFTFLATVTAIGLWAKANGATQPEMIATIAGTALLGSVVEIIFSRFIPLLQKIITPLVSGIIVLLIGINLIAVAMRDIGGGTYIYNDLPEQFGSFQNLVLAAIVLFSIIFFNRIRNKWFRMGSIFFGMLVGYIVAVVLKRVDFSSIGSLSLLTVPIPFKFGLKIAGPYIIPMMLLYLITTVETMGDLTATSMISGESVEGELYMNRIAGGVLADGVNSAISSCFNSFPVTTFSQNNGVIQMTGVASRYVGFIIAGFLALFGIFPIVGGLFSVIPYPVIGGAVLVLAGTIAAGGIRIISTSVLNRRGVMIIAISLGMGIGVILIPEILQYFSPFFKSMFSSPITTGGLVAIFLNIVLPRNMQNQRVSKKPENDMMGQQEL